MSGVRTERDFEQWLLGILDGPGDKDDAPAIRRIDSFEDVGMLTRNRGLVVSLQNGAEFQMTIVQSQEAEGGAEEEETDKCDVCGRPTDERGFCYQTHSEEED